jgi:hypothetical protein
MSDWLSDVIGNDLIAIYEGLYFTEDALIWLGKSLAPLASCAEEIDWLRWMAANIYDKMYWQSCHRIGIAMSACGWRVTPMTPELILGKLAEDPIVFVRRGVAQNRSTLTPVLVRLHDDTDLAVRALVFRNLSNRSRRRDSLRERLIPSSATSRYSDWYRPH